MFFPRKRAGNWPRLLCALLLLGSASTPLHGSASDAIQVIDAQGNTLTLARPARRIIALAPHLAENLFAAGGGAYLVAAVDYSDYPPAAEQLPRVGGFNSLSLEAMIAHNPDLVLAWGSGNGEGIVARLRDLDIPVYVDETRSLADIRRSVLDLGLLAGTSAVAADAVAAFDAALAALQRRITPAARPGVFYQIWHDPLQTIGGTHLISEVIEHCGGSNAFRDVQQLAPRISRESVLARNPQLIVASGSSVQTEEWLNFWRAFPQLAAAESGAIHSLDPDLIERPTLRIIGGMRRLCELIGQQTPAP